MGRLGLVPLVRHDDDDEEEREVLVVAAPAIAMQVEMSAELVLVGLDVAEVQEVGPLP